MIASVLGFDGALDALRGAGHLLIWAGVPPNAAPVAWLVRGTMTIVLALTIARGRMMRPTLLVWWPTAVLATAFDFHAALTSRGIDPWSRPALPMWGVVAGLGALGLGLARWLWRRVPERAL